MSPDRATALFVRVARRLLPAAFVRDFETDLAEAFRDRYARTRRAGGVCNWLRFFSSEASGLLRTAVRPSLPRHPVERLDMRHDLLYALRMIIRTPIVSSIAVLSLALALSAVTAMFATMNTWLLRPFPYPESERLVHIFETDRNVSGNLDAVSPANYFDFREQSDAFEALLAADFRAVILTGTEQPAELVAAVVMPEILPQLGAEPLIGRLFNAGEGAEGQDAVVLLKESSWRSRFGADPAVVGTQLRLDARPYTVVGVLPDTFEYLLGSVDFWLPSDFESRRDDRTAADLRVLGRLREGVSKEQAEEQVAAIAARLADLYPDTNRVRGVQLQSMREEFPGPSDTALIQALMLVALAALVIACFNVAGLYLAKTELRAKEIAVRTALGAGKARMLRLLLTESVILALIAGSLGMVLAVYGIRGIGNALPPEMPRMYAPSLDASTVVFALVLSALAGVVFGISPALQVLSSDRGRSILLETSRGASSGRARKRVRAALVAGEFALALAILMSASVIATLFAGWIDADPGYDIDGVLTAQLTLPEYRYGNDEQRRGFLDALAVQLDSLPGSNGWAAMTRLPRSRGFSQLPVFLEGGVMDEDDAPRVSYSAVSPGFFSTLGIEVRRGRAIQASDRADTVPVAVVNRRFADVVFDGADVVGERIRFEDETLEIVGVIDDIAQFREQGMMPAIPWIYRPLQQAPAARLYLTVRSTGEPEAVAAPLRAAVAKVDADQPISAVQSLRQFIDTTLSGPAYVGELLYQLGFLALALALMGVYGVVAFSVSQQTREIGIRMALGEQTAAVMRGVLLSGARLAGIGILLGLPLAFGVLRLMSTAMSELNAGSALQPVPMVATVVALAFAAVVACYLPARRATRIDPVVALQEE